MNGSKAFLIGCTILAIGFVIASYSKPATSQGRGGFMVASDGDQFVWRVNTSTGELSYCARRSDSTDPRYMQENAPFCSSQSPAVQ